MRWVCLVVAGVLAAGCVEGEASVRFSGHGTGYGVAACGDEAELDVDVDATAGSVDVQVSDGSGATRFSGPVDGDFVRTISGSRGPWRLDIQPDEAFDGRYEIVLDCSP